MKNSPILRETLFSGDAIEKINRILYKKKNETGGAVRRDCEQFNNLEIGFFSSKKIALPGIDIVEITTNFTRNVVIGSQGQPGALSFYFVLEGEVVSDYKNLNSRITLGKGQFNTIFLQDSEAHHLFGEGSKNHLVQFSLDVTLLLSLFSEENEVISRFKEAINEKRSVIASKTGGFINPQMKEILYAILNCPFKGGIEQLYLEAKVYELLALQFQYFESIGRKKMVSISKQELLIAEEVKFIIEGDFSKDWTLNMLAQHTGTNLYTLKKAFQKKYSSGVKEYLQNAKLNHARQLLLETTMNISEVSDAIGYSHPNHFTNAFRKKFGFPPSKLRVKTESMVVSL